MGAPRAEKNTIFVMLDQLECVERCPLLAIKQLFVKMDTFIEANYEEVSAETARNRLDAENSFDLI